MGGWITDTFFGGAEKRAAKKMAGAQDRAGQVAGDTYNANMDTLRPVKTIGMTALNNYAGQVNSGSKPTQAPTFNYSNSDMPSFSYDPNSQPTLRLEKFASGAQQVNPNFQYADNVPQYQGGDQFQFDPSKVGTSDAYKFRVDQANKGLDRAEAGAGKLNSGGRLADIATLNQGLASQEYQNEWDRQKAASDTNYQRGVTDYQNQLQGQGQGFGQAATTYGINADQNAQQFTRDLQSFGVNNQVAMQLYDAASQNDKTAFDRLLAQYNIDKNTADTLFNRAVTSHQFAMDSSNTDYARSQDSLSRLGQLADLGVNATNQAIQEKNLYTDRLISSILGSAEAMGAGYVGAANATKSTLGDIATGYMYGKGKGIF